MGLSFATDYSQSYFLSFKIELISQYSEPFLSLLMQFYLESISQLELVVKTCLPMQGT